MQTYRSPALWSFLVVTSFAEPPSATFDRSEGLRWESPEAKAYQIWHSEDLKQFSHDGRRKAGRGTLRYEMNGAAGENPPKKAFFYVKEDLPSLSVDWRTQHSTGGITTLDRRQYFNLHETLTTSNLSSTQKRDLIENYGVSFGRGIGGFSYHMRVDNIEQAGNKGQIDLARLEAKGKSYREYLAKQPIIQDYAYETIVSAHVSKLYPNDEDLAGFDPEDVEASAEYMAQFLKHYYEDAFRPKYLEPFNEPIAHSNTRDFTVGGERVSFEELFEFHAVVARRVKELTPEVKVGGYAGAWPAYEYWDFGHWADRTQRFIDLVGAEMDFYSLHLYDGKNAGALQKSQRAGSNASALLDLITSYSQKKHGLVKPLIISEYGRTQPDYQSQDYTPARDGEILNSINQLLFVLMERPDHVIKSIPFIVGKSEWVIRNTGRTYPWSLYQPGEGEDEWNYSHLIKFYELWKEVRGTRLWCESSDPDVQIQVFLDENKAFLCLNHLEAKTEEVDLTEVIRSLPTTTQIVEHRLFCAPGAVPQLTRNPLSTLPSAFTLRANETVLYELTFVEAHHPARTVRSERFYSNSIITPIVAGAPLRHTFTLPAGKHRSAVLHLAVSRPHRAGTTPLSPTPSEIRINGRDCFVIRDWPGGDQAGRDQYFGTIKIPVPVSALSETTQLEISYPENGGFVSTAILEVTTPASL